MPFTCISRKKKVKRKAKLTRRGASGGKGSIRAGLHLSKHEPEGDDAINIRTNDICGFPFFSPDGNEAVTKISPHFFQKMFGKNVFHV